MKIITYLKDRTFFIPLQGLGVLLILFCSFDIYVSPSGKDTNNGSAATPKATLSAALRQAREMRRLNAPGIENGINIILKGGTYEQYEPLYVRPEDSGTSQSPTIICGAAGEKVIVSGGVKINNWKKSGKLLVAYVPDFNGRPLDFRQLWVNGKKAVRARDVADFEKMYRIIRNDVQCGDEDSQTAYVCDQVLENLEHGVRLQDQAVIFRTSHHSAHLELELTRRRIPYVKYGGLRYLEAAHVKDLLALYRIADNGRDSPAWFRLLRLLPGVGPVTARRIVDSLEMDAQLESRTPADRAAMVRDLLPEGARRFFDPLLEGLANATGDTVPLRADRLRSAIEPLLCAVYEDADVRLVDLDALVNAASQCARLSDVSSLFVLEPTTSTGDLADDPSIDEDWLVLSTIHSAKGLEFHSVFVIHAADGNIPSDMALSSDEGLEEERRLLYVALTRARRQLTVTFPLRFHHKPPKHPDAHSWALPSRFLTPAVCELVTWSSVGCEEATPYVGGAATPSAITSSVELLLTELFGSATS